MSRLPLVPASFFGMVLGIAGLGNGWRVASRIWGAPGWLGEWVLALAALVWFVVGLLCIAKRLFAPAQAVEEFLDPVQCCFVGLAGVSTLLMAVAVAPPFRRLGLAVIRPRPDPAVRFRGVSNLFLLALFMKTIRLLSGCCPAENSCLLAERAKSAARAQSADPTRR